MFPVRRDVNVIAGRESLRLLRPLKFQRRFAAKQDDPLAFRLVVPEIGRTRLARRNDPLNADLFRLKNVSDQFLRQ